MYQRACPSVEDAQAIVVVDSHGGLIALARTDGCPLPSIQIAIAKAFTAARERRPSRAVGEASARRGRGVAHRGLSHDQLRRPRVGWRPADRARSAQHRRGRRGLPEEEDMTLAGLGIAALRGGG